MSFYNNDATPSNNTALNGIDIQGTANVSNFDNGLRELAAQAKQFLLDLGGGNTVGGSADAITITPAAADTISAAFDGMVIGFVAASNNATVSPTASVGSIGAEPIKKAVEGAETALAAGDIQAGGLYLLRWRAGWDSGNGAWEITNLSFRHSQTALIATGTYTGDGSTSQAITGVGFRPKALWIIQGGIDESLSNSFFTTTEMVTANPNGFAYRIVAGGSGNNIVENNRIISLDSDGFTVDDNGADHAPNANGETYFFAAWG